MATGESLMEYQKFIESYRDLAANSNENTQYFFLENILKARIALYLDTGLHDYDEEVNMYLAELLKSMVTPCAFTENKPYISPFDYEVKSYLNEHHDTRTEYTVYKENADYGLATKAVFMEYFHKGSYWHKVLQGRTDSSERIAFYYKLAASALAHLRGTHTTSVHVFMSLADHVTETMKIIRKVSGDTFEFVEKLSPGSVFHLEKDLADVAKVKIYKSKLDDFLKAWQEHQAEASEEKKVKLITLVEELKSLNPDFKFEEKI
jgi:hypothetical protein